MDAQDDSHSVDALSRRSFSAMTVAAGVAGVAGGAGAATPTVVATDVTINTPDGECDAVLAHPEGAGPWPGVIYWPDAFGVRSAVRDQIRRLAASGYAVLAVNQFYRSGKAPGVVGTLDLSDPTSRARLGALRAPLTEAAIMSDSKAFVAFLDSQNLVSKTRKMGVQGYCMGGAMGFQTAAANPDRIGAVASFHGGALTTDKPDSPHLLIPKTKAEYLVAVADNDDEREPEAKDILRKAFDAAKIPAVVEVYKGSNHGWTQPDHPAMYNQAGAEKAWAELLTLYGRTLA